jgi:Protein of unknown function (DUF2600)
METIRLIEAVIGYGRWLLPLAREELAYWTAQAARIEDPLISRVANAKIKRERRNIESAVFFALLADDWRAAVKRIVAFQLAYELLDGLSEVSPDQGLRLHGALTEAVGGERCDHGGGAYLQALINACRALMVPSWDLLAAAGSVGMAQTLNHAGGDLQGWAEQFAPRLLWWEAAAAGISSLGILAMLSSPAVMHSQITEAYVEIAALSAILDALVDLPTDDASNHNWTRHYGSPQQTAERVVVLADDAQRALEGVHNELLHRALLAGLLAHNLVAPETRLYHAREARSGLIGSVPYVRRGMIILRVRSWLPG